MKRYLDFKVNEQKLEKDSSCSFEGIVSGTRGYLRARFSFNRAWNNFACVAVFKKLLDEYPVPIINGFCEIPYEALDWDKFSVRVHGRHSSGAELTTNEVEVHQLRGGAL